MAVRVTVTVGCGPPLPLTLVPSPSASPAEPTPTPTKKTRNAAGIAMRFRAHFGVPPGCAGGSDGGPANCGCAGGIWLYDMRLP